MRWLTPNADVWELDETVRISMNVALGEKVSPDDEDEIKGVLLWSRPGRWPKHELGRKCGSRWN